MLDCLGQGVGATNVVARSRSRRSRRSRRKGLEFRGKPGGGKSEDLGWTAQEC